MIEIGVPLLLTLARCIAATIDETELCKYLTIFLLALENVVVGASSQCHEWNVKAIVASQGPYLHVNSFRRRYKRKRPPYRIQHRIRPLHAGVHTTKILQQL